MNSIKLTEEHKSKLLEMCKVLFPNIKWQHYDIANSLESKFYPELWVVQNNSEMYPVYIHWFEFCMTYLPVELYRYAIHKCNINPADALKIITINLTQFVDFGRYEINPVDYLYEQFKTLK